MVSSRSLHMPCVGSLFSRYPSRLSWSHHSLHTRLAWVRCSRGIRHAWRGLVAVFSHTLHGFVVLIGGGGRSAGSRVERVRSVERDNIRFRSNVRDSTGLMHSSSLYHPRGAPIFPWYRRKKRKEKKKKNKKRKNKNAQTKQKQKPVTKCDRTEMAPDKGPPPSAQSHSSL